MKSLDIKIAYLDNDFKIVERNKEFYSYFETVGFVYTNIEDIVSNDQKANFLNFIKNKQNQNEFRVYKVKKISGEYVPNLISVCNASLNNKEYLTVRITDVAKSLKYFKDSLLYEKKINYALGITNEYLFSYEKSSNIFKMCNYLQNKKVLVYEQDIDSWKNQIVKDNLIEKHDVIEFETKIEELKGCFDSFSMTITSSLRFSHSMFEKLVFKATRMEDEDKVYMIGRMVPEIVIEQTIKSNEIIEELKIDSLTGVYNKKTIMDFAEKRFAPGTMDNAMLVIVDLDHFKPVNDAYGHLAGDKVLKKAGEILKNIIGEIGIIGRYGGDEFLIILEDMEESKFRGVFRTINCDIRNFFDDMFPDIKITASIGASMFRKDGETFEELFKKADFCLYRAKDKGRNRYVFFRDDLHGELYKKASEAKTEGIKYDVREILELKSMADFLLYLGTEPKKALTTVLQHMLKTYNLDSVNIYYGKSMERMYSVGKKTDALSDAKYVASDDFKEALDGKAFIRIDFTTEMNYKSKNLGKILDMRGVKSSIQCVLGSLERPLGLITFDRLKEGAQWAEYETNCCVMVGAAVNLLPEENLKKIFN